MALKSDDPSSMQTLARTVCFIAATFGVAACNTTGLDFAASTPAATRRAPASLLVAGGQVVVAGPDGYCVDKRATRKNPGSTFVLVASCAALSRRSNAAYPDTNALLTASISDRLAGGAPIHTQQKQLKDFFESDLGRAALAQDGDQTNVEIVQMFVRDDAFIIHARDQSKTQLAGLNQEYWRAVFDLNGKSVAASVVSIKGYPISDDAGLNTLLEFTNSIRSATLRDAQS